MKFEDKKIGENEKVEFFESFFTKKYDDGYRIIMAKEKKNGRKTYLLLNPKGDIIYENQNVEAVWYHKDVVAFCEK